MSGQLDKHVCPRCWFESDSRWVMSNHDCVSDQNDALRYMLAWIKEKKMNYFEAEKSGKPFRIVGTQKWYESSADVRDFILSEVKINGDPRTCCLRLYGEIMRFISSDFEIKKEPRVFWHVSSVAKNDPIFKEVCLFTFTTEEECRRHAKDIARDGVFLVTIFRSVEQDEVRG